MSATSRLIVLFLALAVSQVSQAGAGYYFSLTNDMNQVWFGSGEQSYPRVTIHVAGGSNCWYLKPSQIGINMQSPETPKSLYIPRQRTVLHVSLNPLPSR